MATSLQYDHAPREPWLPAWACSLVVHGGLVALLITHLNSYSPGPVEIPGSGVSITLNPSFDDGDPVSPRDDRPIEPVRIPVLLAAMETESPEEPPTEAPATANATATAPQPAPQQAAPPPRGQYGTGQGKASVRVFGVRGVGTKFVYVFDRSTSMEGAPLAAAKQQLIASLESLAPIHQFQIVFFNNQLRISDITGGGHRIAFATDRNKSLAEKFVGGITADGGTDRLQALRAAIAMQPDVIFFLTDADDPMPPSELAEVERLNRRTSAAICTIEFGSGPQKSAANFLSELARASGGQFGYIDTTRLRDYNAAAKP